MMWFEDYYLWARMIMHGANFCNLQETLANVRDGYASKTLENFEAKYSKKEYIIQLKSLIEKLKK